MSDKKTIAVFFGGRSPEHDVSVVTGLQVMQAIDPSRYDVFAVYITTDGHWYVGDCLTDRANYLPTREMKKSLTEVTLDVRSTAGKKGVLVSKEKALFGGAKTIKEFDVAIPSFHGLYGEDGNIQGLFEVAGVPYTGMRTRASSVTMSKALTKTVMQALDIPTLPFALIKRPKDGYHIAEDEIEKALEGLEYPLCVKPNHLGSSIGVAKVTSAAEVQACLPAIFRYDSAAIVEPFVPNLVEYNVAVSALDGALKTSALERPKNTEELLDFKQKYLSGGGGKKGGQKMPGQSSEGMLSLTRELNPEMDKKAEASIREWAGRLFEGLDGSGAPRIDFIGDAGTGEVWMNEVNPCPGSFGYFLWEAAEDPLLFTDLLSGLIDEALAISRSMSLPADPVPVDAHLLKRST